MLSEGDHHKIVISRIDRVPIASNVECRVVDRYSLDRVYSIVWDPNRASLVVSERVGRVVVKVTSEESVQ